MTKKARLKRKIRRILPLDRIDNSENSGCSGNYIQLSEKIGIKILHSKSRARIGNDYRYYHKSAVQEEITIRMARRRYGCIPRSYGVVIFRDLQNYYRIGILMQHLGEETLWSKYKKNDPENEYSYSIEDKIQTILQKRGISHCDLHSENIMYFKKRFWVIDLNKSSVSFIKPTIQ